MFEWSHRFYVLDLVGEFKERLAGNLEVFDESHRTVENHLTFCEMAVGKRLSRDIFHSHSITVSRE